MKAILLLLIYVALISFTIQMRNCPARSLPRGAVATLDADDLEELSPKVNKELQESVKSSCLMSCSYDINDSCKKNSFIAVSIISSVYKKYCPKGKPCFCRTIVGPIWKDKSLRKKLTAARNTLRDLCSRKNNL